MKNLLSIRSYSTKPVTHSHSYHQVVLPLRGMINIEVGNFSGKVAPGECVVVKAKEPHLFTAEPEAIFVVADMDTLPEHIFNSQALVFAISQPLTRYLHFVESLLQTSTDASLEQQTYTTFVSLLAEQSLQPKIDDRVNQALLYIEQNLAEPLSINHLAQVAYLSPTQFKKLFKQQLGTSVLQHITKLRMERAQALLINTDYSLQMIGELVGYNQAAAFSRKFSQYFGMPPSKVSK